MLKRAAACGLGGVLCFLAFTPTTSSARATDTGTHASGAATIPPRGPLSKARYEAFVESLSDVFIVRCAALTADLATLERLASGRYARRADLLARVTPPAEVRDAHLRFVRALRGFAADSATLVPKLQRVGNPDTASPQRAAKIVQRQMLIVGRDLLPRQVTRDLRRARAEFRAKGYTIDQHPLARGAYARVLQAALAPVGNPYAVPATNDLGELRTKLRERSRVLFDTAKRLEAITAPKNVEQANDDLISGFCVRARDLKFISSSRRLKANSMMRRALHDTLKFMDPYVDDALRTLRKAGYQVPAPPR